MAGSTSYSFGKAEKLKSRKRIDALFSSGRPFHVSGIKVMWLPAPGNTLPQVGVTVSSRHFKKATDRNRIKRLLRETYRLQKEILCAQRVNQSSCDVFFIYTGKELPDYAALYKSMTLALKKLAKLLDEQAQTPA